MFHHFCRSVIFLIFLILLVSCEQAPQEFGTVEGHVTIGPLVPVVREGGLPPTVSPEVYSSREIIVYRSDGITEYTRLQIDPSGNFRGELPAGIYVIDINRTGIDSASHLPTEIEISAGRKTVVDIDIDTGIR